MVDTGRDGKQVQAAMAAQNVYIGRVWPIMPTYVRITVGTKGEMQKFQAAYKDVMSKSAAELAAPGLLGPGGQRHNMLS
jgi:histidinol-phosphate aminotransferase